MYLITDSKVTVNTLGLTNDEIKECINENLKKKKKENIKTKSIDWNN